MSASRAPECLRRRILPIAWSLLVWTIATVGGAAAQTFDQWFNTRIDAVLAARLGQNSGARETEAPAIARGSTAIVNETGFSDLIGIALGGGALTHGGDGGAEGASTALTVTPFAVLAGILGIDPNDPFMYEARSAWRAVSFTLGTETTEADDGSESRATLIGFKLKLWSRRTNDAQPRRGSRRPAAWHANRQSAAMGRRPRRIPGEQRRRDQRREPRRLLEAARGPCSIPGNPERDRCRARDDTGIADRGRDRSVPGKPSSGK
jgi:hypothetical protein